MSSIVVILYIVSELHCTTQYFPSNCFGFKENLFFPSLSMHLSASKKKTMSIQKKKKLSFEDTFNFLVDIAKIICNTSY